MGWDSEVYRADVDSNRTTRGPDRFLQRGRCEKVHRDSRGIEWRCDRWFLDHGGKCAYPPEYEPEKTSGKNRPTGERPLRCVLACCDHNGLPKEG